MTAHWVTLPHTWTLQDTQAGLNVIFAFLSAGGIFVLVRSFWVSAARNLARDKDVPVYNLLSLNTIGETFDVAWLLRRELLKGQYVGILVQCVGVLLLTTCALLSGFIARFATRNTTVLVERSVFGALAQRGVASTYFNSLEISVALAALRKADIPQDELLDFWPDPASEWHFAPEQWTNHSWAMSCKFTPLTPLTGDLRATNDSCSSGFNTQLPFLNDIWDDKASTRPVKYGINIWRDEPTMTRNGIIFGFGDQILENSWDDSLKVFTKMNFRMSMMFLDGPIYDWNYTTPGNCMYEAGPLKRAEYTKAECDLVRNTKLDQGRSAEDIANWGAFPEADHTRVLDVLLEYYGNTWYRELWSGKPVTTIDGPEMALFYQAFGITRATRGFLYDNTTSSNVITSKILDVPVRAPQVSLAAVTVCAVGALIVLVGLFNYFHFVLANRKRLHRTPQTKLDWMLQTLRHENHPDVLRLGPKHQFHSTVGLGISHQSPEVVGLSKGDDYDVGGPTTVSLRRVEVE